MAKIGNDYYPELMGCVCVLNGPPAAAWAVRVAKRWLDPDTASKIELYSPDGSAAAIRDHLGASGRARIDACRSVLRQ